MLRALDSKIHHKMRYSVSMRAKKSLGQHFLKSQKALSQIIDAGDIHTGDTVLEIGPGHGVLTELLLAKGATVIAIEKDRELIPLLEEKFAPYISDGKLHLIEADILKWNPASLGASRYKLVANIPYYITGAIIEQFLSTQHQPERMVLLMQREVAERVIARDGKQSILSVAVHVYGTPRIVGRVPPGAFVPPPTVESAILLIEHITRDFFVDCDERAFFAILKSIFGKKRKQIGGSLAEYTGDKGIAHAALAQATIDPKSRPEDLMLSQWKLLTQILHTSSQKSVQ